MAIFQQLLLWVVPLGVVIFFHELGHFLAAKWRGVKVLRFSIGFGPRLWGWTRGGTEYRLAWIPLGGYVQMAGDGPTPDGMPTGPENFLSHPWPGRIAIALGGPGANFVVAFFALLATGLIGIRVPDRPAQLGPLADTTAAWGAGFREGDRVVAVSGTAVSSWRGMGAVVDRAAKGEALRFQLERGGGSVAIEVAAADRDHVLGGFVPPPVESRVAEVRVGTPAYTAGVKSGDLILAVDGRPVRYFHELPPLIGGKANQKIELLIERDGRHFTLFVEAVSQSGDRKARDAMIGITAPVSQVYVERFSVAEAVGLAWTGTLGMTAKAFESMALIVRRPADYYKHLGGPMLIAQVLADEARKGLDYFLQTFAFINVAIMSFNLLPIPILDGGHVSLAVLEAVRRRTLSMRGYLRFQKVGLTVVGALLIFILVNDPLREIRRQQSIRRGPQPEQVGTPTR